MNQIQRYQESLRKRYAESLENFPTPGGGGAHPHELKVANLGFIAGLSADQIFQDIRNAIPTGSRKVSDSEITQAINKAQRDHRGGTFTQRPRPKPVVNNGKVALEKILSQGEIIDEVDLGETSPRRLLEEPKDDPGLLLSTLYDPTDLLWIGERHDAGILGDTIRTAAEWGSYFKNGGRTGPHIIPNPMTGQKGTTKEGKPSFRSDSTVKTYRYCLVEFDDLSREDQIRFWSAARLPVVCLIDSGGKSIHGWLDVQKRARVTTPEQWQLHIKTNLYDQLLTPLGVDSSCSNASRLSRLPGHYRMEKQAFQRLLWLSPEGRFIG
jgi:hypothetical protein